MSLPVYQNTIVNDRGDVLPEALLRVRTDPGQSNVTLYKDRDASDVLTNVGDVYADIDGFVRFYLPPGVYRMHVIASGYERTYRHVQIANLNEYNVVSAEQYALAITDAGNNIQLISDAPVNVEIPTDKDVEFPMWSEVTLIQAGDGIITLSGDVTIQNPSGGPVKSMGKGSSIKLTLIGGNVWLARVSFDRIISGDIEQTGDLKITGNITHQGSSTQTGNSSQTGNAQITGRLDVDNLRFDGNTVASTNTNGHVEITPNGSGRVRLNKNTDVDGDLNVAGDTVLHGNLHVKGTTTIIDSTEVDIGDNIIRLNANETGQPTLSAGFEVERGLQANVSFLWDEFNKRWTTGGQALDVSQLIVNGQALDGDDVTWIAAARAALDFVDPADGGLLVNNQKTGIGPERVLTESDLEGGGGSGEGYVSVADFIASIPTSNAVRIISYYGDWEDTVEGPKGGFDAHRTGYTAASPSVGNPVVPATIGTGAQSGLFWTADGAEWKAITRNIEHDNVADMVADPSLYPGDTVQTIAHTAGYGHEGGNRYQVVESGAGKHDNGAYIDLGNGLQAMGLFPNGPNIYQFGAKNDGTADDTDAIAAFSSVAGRAESNELVNVGLLTIGAQKATPLNGSGAISLIGDSISHGAFARNLFTDGWTRLLARMLNAENNASSYGFAPLLSLGSGPTSSVDIHSISFTGSWSHGPNAGNTLAGTALMQSAPGSKIRIHVPFFQNRAEIFYVKQPGGGTFTISVNSSVLHTVNTDSTFDPHAVQEIALTDNGYGECLIEIEITVEGPVEIDGIAYLSSVLEPTLYTFAQSGRKLENVSDATIDYVCANSSTLIMALGHNDTDTQKLRTRVDRLIRKCNEAKIKLYVLDFRWASDRKDPVRVQLRRLAEGVVGATYVPLPDYLTADGSTVNASYLINTLKMWEDGSHPNVAGNKWIAETVAAVMGLGCRTKRDALAYHDYWLPLKLDPAVSIENSLRASPHLVSSARMSGEQLLVKLYVEAAPTASFPVGEYQLQAAWPEKYKLAGFQGGVFPGVIRQDTGAQTSYIGATASGAITLHVKDGTWINDQIISFSMPGRRLG